ncbi:MAG: hypothetical protein R3B48_23120 [Kofleriaceae bacterium]
MRSRPAVRGAASLVVELKNGAGLAGDTFNVEGRAFPLTFSVSSPGRNGTLELLVSAKNATGELVGRGATSVPIDAEAGEVLLDSADFVVNTQFAEDQFLTNDFEAVGAQLAANPSGEWIATFRERCTAAACNVFARRFDVDGQPLNSTLAAGTNAFTVNTGRVGVISSSAAAASADKTLLFWETTNASDIADGVACRPIDRAGAATTEQRLVTEPSTDVVVSAALPNGNFAVVWAGRTVTTDPLNLRTLVVDGTCTPLSTLQPVGTLLPSIGLRQSSVAAGPDSYLIAWKSDNTIRARTVALNGTPATPDTLLLMPSGTDEYHMVRVASYADGFVVVAARRSGTIVSLELFRVTASATAAPMVLGSATLVTDGVDSAFEGFSVAAHPQGPFLVTWHGCGTRGDGEGCGVFGRLFDVTGAAQGDAFLVPTTTALDQDNSSATALQGPGGTPLFVVAWNDLSAAAPDTGGKAVRARILYPPSSP